MIISPYFYCRIYERRQLGHYALIDMLKQWISKSLCHHTDTGMGCSHRQQTLNWTCIFHDILKVNFRYYAVQIERYECNIHVK